ncbi:MAG TPA: hypothetical protein VLJ16_12740 [Acidobacteriota bacterium]|nr:hypothetical protein [Acidobacteriota bacterium]
MSRGAVAIGLWALLAGAGGTALFADPLLSRPETIDGRILIFPDHRAPNVFYYVPAGLALVRAFGQPQFFFYKYVYVKAGASDGPRTIAGGVLALAVEFADATEALRKAKGPAAEFRPVPIEALTCALSYTRLEPDGAGEKTEELTKKEIVWTRKTFTLPLGRDSASYLWKIFEDGKATGLSVECEFAFKGYEIDDEGKLKDGERSARLSFAVPVSMAADPALFKLVNLADKVSFNYRRLGVLCFDFVNGTNGGTVKLTAEIEVLTAKKQRDSRTVTFTAGSEPQVDLAFDIPEAKGGTYRYRLIRIFADGRSEKGEWTEAGEMFLDLTTYDIVDKD